MSEPILQFFKFDHLPEKMQLVSKPFGELAQRMEETLPRNAERSVALRKLLEAKDAAVRALIAVALLVLLLPIAAHAQDVAQVVAGAVAPQPVWATLLIALAPFLIGAILAIHPLLKLGAWLHAKAEDVGTSTLAKTAFLGGESIVVSLDHFLEAEQLDGKDLLDPAKRSAALKHIEAAAASAALPALSDAASAMGASWITGKASQAIDAAIAHAPAVAAQAVAAAAPAPVARPS